MPAAVRSRSSFTCLAVIAILTILNHFKKGISAIVQQIEHAPDTSI
jgi:hypothetical protein